MYSLVLYNYSNFLLCVFCVFCAALEEMAKSSEILELEDRESLTEEDVRATQIQSIAADLISALQSLNLYIFLFMCRSGNWVPACARTAR